MNLYGLSNRESSVGAVIEDVNELGRAAPLLI